MIKFVYNPIEAITKAAENLYPSIKADVQFNPSMKIPGHTVFPLGSDTALVDINAELPFDLAVETLADELAHVATKTTKKSDSSWLEARKKILAEYNRIVDIRFEKYQKQ